MGSRPTEDEMCATYRATIDELFDFVATRRRGERELAEDIAQETWLRAVEPANTKARLAAVEKLRTSGSASDVDLLKAQLAVKEFEMEPQRLAVRLRSAK